MKFPLSVLTAFFLSGALQATTYLYDGQDRLISVGYVNGPAISYTYDAAGNLTSQSTNRPLGGGDTGTTTNSGGAANTNSPAFPLYPPCFISSDTAIFQVNRSNSLGFSTMGAPTPTITATPLPTWLTRNGNQLAGTPTNVGVYTFTLTASNSVGTASQPYTLYVKAAQTITPFVGITNISYSSNPVISITLPNASSGLPVSIAVSGPANLNGNQLSLTGTGTVTLFATQEGNDLFLPANPISRGFTILP